MHYPIQRRRFVQSVTCLAAGTCCAATDAPRPRILLRSSWQTSNIGDIAHTPGVLRLLETYIPHADVVLWPTRVDNGVDKILKSRFPQLVIANDAQSKRQALEQCDFLLHGSGPSLVAERFVGQWIRQTGKPYGVYGIGLPARKHGSTEDEPLEELAKTVEILSGAEFVFFRETKSLALAKQLGCRCPTMDFAPDGAFACDLQDRAKAETFLERHNLAPGKFLCCIPRYRYTPVWTIASKNKPFDPVRHARNESMKEHDHVHLRQAIVEAVQNTDLKVLICPEDQTQMALGKEMILDKLPATIRNRVVWRPNYWLTGEAVSTYVQSAGLFGNEMHSPILCIGHAIPAIVCRFAEQTTKGLMWDDIGLSQWLFDLDVEEETRQIVPAVMELASNPDAAMLKAQQAREFVRGKQQETMSVVAAAIGRA